MKAQMLFIGFVHGKKEKGSKLYAVGHIMNGDVPDCSLTWIEVSSHQIDAGIQNKMEPLEYYDVIPVISGRYVSYSLM